MTIVSFSFERRNSAIVKATKKAIGTVKMRILGSIKRYNFTSSAKFISINEVMRAICKKNTIDIMIKSVLNSDANELIKFEKRYFLVLSIRSKFPYLLKMRRLFRQTYM